MATVLLAWDFGGGYGHAARIVRLAKELRVAGHHVVIAARELPRVTELCDKAHFALLQAPRARSHNCVAVPRTFAHVLWNAGYGDAAVLQARSESWTKLLDSVNPDLIVFDHAPTALLAARGRNVRRVVIGTGFSCPPDCEPLPDLRPWLPPMRQQLLLEERHVLGRINQVLTRRGVATLERVSQLYAEVDDTFLTTLPEFDHYPTRAVLCASHSSSGRADLRYRGPWPSPGGEPPVWPAGGGKRIYAYLSPSPQLSKVLQALALAGCSTIVFGCLDPAIRERYSAPNICFEARLLDPRQAAAECDIAVLNGGQATTIGCHLAGKPILHVPMFLEQALNAMCSVQLGAGLMAFPGGQDRTVEQITELLTDPRYAEAARRFANKYRNLSAESEIANAVARLNELAESCGTQLESCRKIPTPRRAAIRGSRGQSQEQAILPERPMLTPYMRSDEKEAIVKLIQERQFRSVLEYGSGGSTVEFSALPGISRWLSIEHDPQWAERTTAAISKLPPDIARRIEVRLITDMEQYVFSPWNGETFDLVFVDGRRRKACMCAARERLEPGQAVLLHDAFRLKYQSSVVLFHRRTVLTMGTPIEQGLVLLENNP
jgi:predicted O-methyltransferase YrrM